MERRLKKIAAWNKRQGEKDAEELCTKLNRLAALEAVCREIVENAPTSEDEFEGDDIPIWESIPMSTKYLIAQKLKAVLEEA